MKVIFTAEAEEDLEQISDYIGDHNAEAALTFARNLREKCQKLADAPWVIRCLRTLSTSAFEGARLDTTSSCTASTTRSK